MHRLREIQRDFHHALVAPNPGEDSAMSPRLRVNNIDPARRIQIYRNNIRTNLTAALQSIYPVVEKLVGDGFFSYSATEYIQQHPSQSGDIRAFGAEYAQFLADFEPAKTVHYLPDVARLEWYYHEAFHAEDSSGLDLDQLGKVDPDDYSLLRFALHPATRLIKSSYPIFRIWRANTWETEWEAIDLNSGGDNVLIARAPDTGNTELISVPSAVFELLHGLATGLTLGDAIEATLAIDPEFNLSLFVAEYVRSEILVGFSTK